MTVCRIREQPTNRTHSTHKGLRKSGNVSISAQAAGLSRSGVYARRESDDVFAKEWEEAEEIAADRLEAEAWRRGVEGVPEPLVSAGKLAPYGAGLASPASAR